MKVQLVGQMALDINEIEKFLKNQEMDGSKLGLYQTEDSDLAPEVAGRICYMSFDNPRPGGNIAYLQHIKEVGHGSVLEHAVFSFIISGVSRILTHELVRHRAGMAYSQLSQRYVDEAERQMVIPDSIQAYPELVEKWKDHVTAAKALYIETSETMAQALPANMPKTERLKAARQDSRYILPHGMETIIYVTANGRALRHILEMRGSQHALPEIRQMALLCLGTVSHLNLFSDYTVDSFIKTQTPKV